MPKNSSPPPHAAHHGQHWAARHYSQLLYGQLKVLVTRVASDDEDDVVQAKEERTEVED
jgi:hypothetical protein